MSAKQNLIDKGVKFSVSTLNKEDLEIFIKPNATLRAAAFGVTNEDVALRNELGPEIVEMIKAGKNIPLHPLYFDAKVDYYTVEEGE